MLITTGNWRVWRYRLQAASFDRDVSISKSGELTWTYLQRPPEVDTATPAFMRLTTPSVGFLLFGFRQQSGVIPVAVMLLYRWIA